MRKKPKKLTSLIDEINNNGPSIDWLRRTNKTIKTQAKNRWLGAMRNVKVNTDRKQ